MADFLADSVADSFSASFAHLHLLKHPFYQAWMKGTLPIQILREYATQYYHHVDRFPRYLSAIHSLCEDTAQRLQILENLNEEEGTAYGVSHPELWLQFAEGVGVDRAKVVEAPSCSSIQKVAAQFFHFSRSSFHEGLGALYSYESQVPEIAESKLEGLKSRYNIHDSQTLGFFEVHRKADLNHRAIILKMLEALPEQQKTEARAASQATAKALWDFLSEMHSDRQACA